jgi:2-hydroxy-6-oxonona-2,4-dienedioate hydrolase
MNDISPKAILEAQLSRCREVQTPCCDGQMVWRIWDQGKADLPPLVLLHGGSGAWNHWVRNIAHLEAQYRVIAADLPGCGDSADAIYPYSADDLVAILSQGLDLVLPDDEAFDLVAFSFGGVLSGLIAHAQARRIRSVTIVGSPLLGLTGTGPANDLVDVPLDLPPEEATPLYRRNLQNLMVHDPAAVDDLALTLHAANMAKGRLRSRRIARSSVLADSVRNLPCPLNCIFGEKDVTLHPDLAGVRDYAEQVHPGVDFRVVPDAGHWVQFEASEQFNTVLSDVLAGRGTKGLGIKAVGA